MPKESKVDNIEKLKRVRAIQDLILAGHDHGDILTSIITKWGISERQAARYLKDGYEGFAELTGHEMKKRRGFHIAARMKLMKANSQRPKLQLDILDSLAKIEGIMVQKLDLSTDGAKIEFYNVQLPSKDK